MENSKKITSDLDSFFKEARQQESLLSINEVNELIKNNSLTVKKNKNINKWRWIGIIVAVVFINTGIFVLSNKKTDNDKSEKTNISIAASRQNIDQSKPNEANNNNISLPLAEEKKEKKEISHSSKSKPVSHKPDHLKIYFEGDATVNFESNNDKISMIVNGSDEVTELRINDEKIERENFGEYQDIISEGLKFKEERERSKASLNPEEAALKKANLKLKNAIVQQLMEDNLIAGEDPFDFKLTGDKLFINDQVEPQEIFEKYKELYEKTSGEKLQPDYRLHIKR